MQAFILGERNVRVREMELCLLHCMYMYMYIAFFLLYLSISTKKPEHLSIQVYDMYHGIL